MFKLFWIFRNLSERNLGLAFTRSRDMIIHIRLSYDGDFKKYYKLMKYEASVKDGKILFCNTC
jgi:hypothetical protein